MIPCCFEVIDCGEYESMKDGPPLAGGEIGRATESCPSNAEEALAVIKQEEG